nr:MAG TPA: hypothetical protein [Caudoviricetes sp.]
MFRVLVIVMSMQKWKRMLAICSVTPLGVLAIALVPSLFGNGFIGAQVYSLVESLIPFLIVGMVVSVVTYVALSLLYERKQQDACDDTE